MTCYPRKRDINSHIRSTHGTVKMRNRITDLKDPPMLFIASKSWDYAGKKICGNMFSIEISARKCAIDGNL